ncbi:hypothetical protein Pcinc_030534 [Petrolisthes cinctipes]|uniref:Uncharacterized protein n=1 Tax=Petrolisthes cinctipes TaxID=88211 RepID=A0AAE1K432_PETCI|nr:hypothetical protein Pcinc_030534 [Petrolisthes cinctipes]
MLSLAPNSFPWFLLLHQSPLLPNLCSFKSNSLNYDLTPTIPSPPPFLLPNPCTHHSFSPTHVITIPSPPPMSPPIFLPNPCPHYPPSPTISSPHPCPHHPSPIYESVSLKPRRPEWLWRLSDALNCEAIRMAWRWCGVRVGW